MWHDTNHQPGHCHDTKHQVFATHPHLLNAVICVPWLIDMSHMTHWYEWHERRGKGLCILMACMTSLYDSFTWLIHMYIKTRWCVGLQMPWCLAITTLSTLLTLSTLSGHHDSIDSFDSIYSVSRLYRLFWLYLLCVGMTTVSPLDAYTSTQDTPRHTTSCALSLSLALSRSLPLSYSLSVSLCLCLSLPLSLFKEVHFGILKKPSRRQ